MNLSASTPAARRAFHALAGFTPLLLSLAVGNAYAVDVTIVGRNGADGTPGVTGPTPNGGDGQSALPERYVFGSQDASNTLKLRGGNGGMGGAPGADALVIETRCDASGYCWDAYIDYRGGASGMGGNGGEAVGSVTTRSGDRNGFAEARVVGGAGGEPFANSSWGSQVPRSPNLGNGGDATSATSVFVTGAASAHAVAYATGGDGSVNGEFPPADSANGGRATARAYGRSDTGAVTVSANATAGTSGYGKMVGQNAELIDAVSGSTSGTLSLMQRAQGGSIGFNSSNEPQRAGDAVSTLTLSDARARGLSATIQAIGGAAGLGQDAFNGNGYATLTLASTRAGASVDGTVLAEGGGGFLGPAGAGGPIDYPSPQRPANAEARATLTGLAAVSGSATANGGTGRDTGGGSALAGLTLSGPGLVSGSATARGGWAVLSGPARWYTSGSAQATLTMTGAGARGTATALGAGAVTSEVNVNTSGVLAVDVVSRADYSGDPSNPYGSGELNANIDVRTAAGGGLAPVTAAASADGLSGAGVNAHTTVRVAANGAIAATGDARAGYRNTDHPTNGAASSSVRGETSGQHAVTATATALANTLAQANERPAVGGSVAADAYGRSGSGVVNVRAEARGLSDARAAAVAVTLERGGVSNALANASGRDVAALASMSALDRQGRTITFSGSAAGTASDSAGAASSNQFAVSSLSPGALGASVQSSVMAAPERAALLAVLPAAQALQNVVGAGMQAMAHADAFDVGQPLAEQNTVGEFQFAAEAGEHLQVLFLSGSGQFDTFELSISNNGAELFSRAFDAASAQQFFNGYLLDLGALGTGMQNLRISSSMAFYQPGSFAFNYLVGSGVGAVAAVPEASTWLMLLVGMGGMLLVARRRRA